MADKRETLSSIAARLGVSISTVSRTLSGQADKYRISRETAERVLREVDKTGYFPNDVARNIRSKLFSAIGLLLPSVANPFFTDIASAIIDEAGRQNYNVIMLDSCENEERQKKNISALMSLHLEGIVAAPCGSDPRLFEEINKEYLPVVLIDRYFSRTGIPYVSTNNFLGAFEAVDYLINRGHSDIACIQGSESSMPSHRRVAGYRDAMSKAGLSAKTNVSGNDFSLSNGYLETKLLLKRECVPTAIFALSNTIALGAIKAIAEEGLKIPDDISIVAFDDSVYLDFIGPGIDHISQPVAEMGRLAMKILTESIGSGTRMHTQLELSPTLIRRGSVKNLA